MQKNEKRNRRRQTLGSLALPAAVLGLAIICAVAYFHVRGGMHQ